MIDPDGLHVWCGQKSVGFLWRNSRGQIGFSYDETWLIDPERFALSNQLPLQKGDFLPEDALAHHFFANLLPEGGAREQVRRDLKIPDTDFDLLRAIGGECAGALTILDIQDDPKQEHHYQKLTDTDLENLVRRRGQPKTWKTHERPRLSLAGAQNKCPVLLKDQAYWLPLNESPSSHILKFEVSDYRHLPAYETFTTMLARSVGLPVVDIELRYINKIPFACILRYDRVPDEEGELTRLHQEDFCQALGYSHYKKYELDDGPSFADCCHLVMENSTEPAEDLINLLNWQIFNVLAGNSDGHAKNLSLLYLPSGEVKLAPFYDLICTRAIKRIDERLAFAVGGERVPALIKKNHWVQMAEECGIGSKLVLSYVEGMAHFLLNHHENERRVFEAKYGPYGALEEVEKVITTQCKKALKS